MQTRALELAREALLLAILLSLPVLVAALVVGAAMGWVASRAQLSDPAVTQGPRVVAVGVALALGGAWMGTTLLRFTRALWDALPGLVP